MSDPVKAACGETTVPLPVWADRGADGVELIVSVELNEQWLATALENLRTKMTRVRVVMTVDQHGSCDARVEGGGFVKCQAIVTRKHQTPLPVGQDGSQIVKGEWQAPASGPTGAQIEDLCDADD